MIKKKPDPCKYNLGVNRDGSCTKAKCKTCGWNPAIEKLRKEKLNGR